MTDNDINIICEKLDSLHEKILKSKFAEKVYESEIMALILAVETINHQKAEIADLTYKIVGIMHSVDKWLEGDELKQDEVNRAITMREKTLQITEKQQAEIERLQKLVAGKQTTIDELSALITDTCEDCKVKLEANKVKSEAIKEFAEKLKDYHKNYEGFCVVDDDDIDNLVAEMTEGRKNDN